MDFYQILCIVLGVTCVIMFVAFGFLNHKYTKTLKGMSGREAENVEEKHGVRYSIDQTTVDENGEQKITLNEKDVVISPGETEIVGKKNKVKPGKYTLLSSLGEEEKFNVRIGKFVKEYSHNQQVILAEGQEISAVNATIILR